MLTKQLHTNQGIKTKLKLEQQTNTMKQIPRTPYFNCHVCLRCIVHYCQHLRSSRVNISCEKNLLPCDSLLYDLCAVSVRITENFTEL